MATQKHSNLLWLKSVSVFAVFAVIFCIDLSGSFGSTPNELFVNFDSTPGAVLSRLNQDPTVVRSRPVGVNFDVLGAERIFLNFFDDTTFTGLKGRVEKRATGRYTWFGHIEDIERSQVILVVDGADMVGNISIHGNFYHIRPLGNGTHVIREIDQSAFPEDDCAPPIEDLGPAGPESRIVPPTSGYDDDGSTIDVLVVYTLAAATASANIGAEIQLAVDETNQSYINSLINPRIRLVHAAQVVYTETGNISTDVNRLKNLSDGYMDEVHTLRNQYAADIVALIVENGGNYCGIAYGIMSPVSPAFEDKAFCVVDRGCATGYYSFGHELGHLQAARHDWFVDSSNNSPFTYNHGYVDPGDNWRTIMAYGNDCGGCTRLKYWANPDVLYGGQPMGVPEGQYHAADNRKTINNTAYTVANFRVASAGVPPVLFSDNSRVLIDIAPLGTIGASQVTLAVYTEWPGPTNFGIAWKSYFPDRSEWGWVVEGDNVWVTQGHFGIWNGSGSTAYAINQVGVTWSSQWSDLPPDIDTGAEPPDQR